MTQCFLKTSPKHCNLPVITPVSLEDTERGLCWLPAYASYPCFTAWLTQDLRTIPHASPPALILDKACTPLQVSPGHNPQGWEGVPHLLEDSQGHQSTATGPGA